MPPRKKKSTSPAASESDKKKQKSSSGSGAATGGGSASPDASIVLVGMRGAGKTHLGQAAAAGFGLDFLDLDWEYEKIHGKIMDTVKEHGWPTFREREVALLRDTLASRPTGAVIACGGGIVETEAGRELLQAHWPVLQSIKPIDDIEKYLGIDSTRPSLGEPPRVAYERRKGYYDAVSDLDHLAAPGVDDFRESCDRLLATLRRLRHAATVEAAGGSSAAAAKAAPHPTPLPHEHSFFISLTYPDLAAALPLPAALWENTDCVELRADLLSSLEPDNVRTQIALLRAHCPLPILFTIRSKSEAGTFTGSDEQYFALNLLAARAGCEWIDLEASKDGAALHHFVSQARRLGARFVGSNHVLGPLPTADEIGSSLRRCGLGGRADVVKFVGMAREPSQALAVHAAAIGAKLSVPHIALAMSECGRMSRVLNSVWTPVTHPALPFKAAPGQMSVAEILAARKSLGYLPSRKFFIFGCPTKHSPSPAMHNAAFAANGTAHTYGVCETEEPAAVVAALRAEGAGGGSVTIPLKEKLFDVVDVLSPSATAIGSLNTLSVHADGQVHADNTDWVGIRNLLVDTIATRAAPSPPPTPSSLTALVMGGGGTARAACYALQQMGIGAIHIYNRSGDKAASLATEFGGVHMEDLPAGVAALGALDLVVSCVPGAAGLSLTGPELCRLQPIVLDAAYRPRDTPLLAASKAAGCVTIEGIEMLYEQGCAQAVIWTHRPAPRAAVAKGLAAFLESQEFGPLPPRIAAELK